MLTQRISHVDFHTCWDIATHWLLWRLKALREGVKTLLWVMLNLCYCSWSMCGGFEFGEPVERSLNHHKPLKLYVSQCEWHCAQVGQVQQEQKWKNDIKDQKYDMKSRESSCSRHLSLFLCFTAVLCVSLTLFSARWQTNSSIDRLYHALCTQRLSVGRRAVCPRLPMHCQRSAIISPSFKSWEKGRRAQSWLHCV